MILASTTAFPDPPRYSATLAQPLPAKKEFVINENIWRCVGSTCVIISHPENAASVRACRALQHQAGELTAYTAAGKPYDAGQIAACNSKEQ